MSEILYYSRYCNHSKRLLSLLSKSSFQEQIHFVCIDQRTNKPDGSIHILLDNGETMILPPNVKRVPALLLINRGYQVLYGDQILQHYKPSQDRLQQQPDEPSAFALSGMGCGLGDVASDNFSYLDIPADEMMAKGNGGLVMMESMNQARVDEDYTIETPPDTYQPDKVGNVSMSQLQQQRSNDVKPQR